MRRHRYHATHTDANVGETCPRCSRRKCCDKRQVTPTRMWTSAIFVYQMHLIEISYVPTRMTNSKR